MNKYIKNNKLLIGLLLIILVFIVLNVYLIISNYKLRKRIELFYNSFSDIYIGAHDKVNEKVIINDSVWKKLLKDKTGLDVEVPKDWNVFYSYVKINDDSKTNDNNTEFKIIFDMSGSYTFEDFTNNIFNQAKKMSYDYFENDVDTWKNGHGYYPVEKFSDAIIGNIFYDRADEENSNSGLKHKVRMYKENNRLVLDVNYYGYRY